MERIYKAEVEKLRRNGTPKRRWSEEVKDLVEHKGFGFHESES